MLDYQKRLAVLLAESGSLFFKKGLKLKDGRPTPYFINLGVFRDGRLSLELGRCFADWMVANALDKTTEVIVGPSYKGSALAQAAALALYLDHKVNVAFEYDRKEAKTHGEATIKDSLFVTGALRSQAQVLIIDDVGTSMATKVELLDKLRAEDRRLGLNLSLQGVILAVDRQQSQAVYDAKGQVALGQRGEDAIANFTAETGLAVWSLLGISQALSFLRQSRTPVLVEGQMQLADQALEDQLAEYLAVYGRQS